MNSWNPYRLATLVVAVVSLVVGLAIMPAQAHHCKGAHDFSGCVPAGGGGGGGPTPQECDLEFRGTFDDRLTDRVGSERLLDPAPGDPYINDVDKVQFTSRMFQTSGKLRFDTNGTAKVEKPQDIRKVMLDFRGAIISHPVVFNEVGFYFALKSFDIRFDNTDAVGLNVCSLNFGGTGHVVLDITFLTALGEDYALSYGCRLAQGVPPDDGNLSKAVVTRTGDSTWTIEGVSACLRDGPNAYYPRIDLSGDGVFFPADDQILMPFRIELIDLNALP